MQNDELLSTAEAAEVLGKSVATLNRWAALGKIVPAFAFPGEKGARMFTPAEVERVRQADLEPDEAAS